MLHVHQKKKHLGGRTRHLAMFNSPRSANTTRSTIHKFDSPLKKHEFDLSLDFRRILDIWLHGSFISWKPSRYASPLDNLKSLLWTPMVCTHPSTKAVCCIVLICTRSVFAAACYHMFQMHLDHLIGIRLQDSEPDILLLLQLQDFCSCLSQRVEAAGEASTWPI